MLPRGCATSIFAPVLASSPGCKGLHLPSPSAVPGELRSFSAGAPLDNINQLLNRALSKEIAAHPLGTCPRTVTSHPVYSCCSNLPKRASSYVFLGARTTRSSKLTINLVTAITKSHLPKKSQAICLRPSGFGSCDLMAQLLKPVDNRS